MLSVIVVAAAGYSSPVAMLQLNGPWAVHRDLYCMFGALRRVRRAQINLVVRADLPSGSSAVSDLLHTAQVVADEDG